MSGQVHECSFCDGRSVHHMMVPAGVAPAKAKDENTIKDERHQVIVRFCARHWAWLQAKILEMGLQP